MKGGANDEAGDEDDRVIVVLEGPLEKLNWDSVNPKRKKQRPATIGARSLKRTHDPLGH